MVWGLRIGIAGLPEHLEAVRRRQPSAARLRPAGSRRLDRLYAFAGRRPVTLEADGSRLGGGSLSQAIVLWRSDLARWVAEHARGGLFVHAGLVAHRGRAILIPGRSRSGKTTLVAALVRAGARCLSDEHAVVDGSGRARGAGLGLDHPRAGRPVRIALVVRTCYQPGARWQPRRLEGGRALLELLPHVVAARRRPAEALARLRAALARAEVLSGPRGEARATAPVLLAALPPGPTAGARPRRLRRSSAARASGSHGRR